MTFSEVWKWQREINIFFCSVNFVWPLIELSNFKCSVFLSYTDTSNSATWKHSTTPLTSGFYHIEGDVPRWLKKVELNVDGQTSQQVSAAVRAEKKGVTVRDGEAHYFDNGIQLDGIHSSDRNLSLAMLCEDGITRRRLTFVAGCTEEKSDFEVRSSCSSDINFPKCKYL